MGCPNFFSSPLQKKFQPAISKVQCWKSVDFSHSK